MPACLWCFAAALAQAGASSAKVTEDDYARAERFLSWNVHRYVVNGEIRYRWMGNEDRLWYVRTNAAGEKEVVIVDARKGEQTTLIDRQPVTDAAWKCQVSSWNCFPQPERPPGNVTSPDGKWAVFLRDENLWIRATDSRESFPLTTDGAPGYAYAMSPGHPVADARQQQPLRPLVLWSPDSRYLLTHRLEQRKVKEAFLTQSVPEDGTLRPKLYAYRYAMPGDESVTELQPLVFDVTARRPIVLAGGTLPWPGLTPIEHQGTWWSSDSKSVYYLRRDRFSKSIALIKADAASGAVKEILRETSNTIAQVSSGGILAPPVVRTLRNGDVLWYSPRDGWGHLYYYDGATGALRRQITRGHWVVRTIVSVDEPTQTIYFMASGREKNRDPYEQYLYSVRLDGSRLRLLTPEEGNHEAPQLATDSSLEEPPSPDLARNPFSPSGRYFIDRHSRPDRPPLVVLRAVDGRLIKRLEEADISRLQARGYVPVEPFEAQAADGTTRIYGNLFRPSTFDPQKKYPIIDAVYPGPSGTRVRKSFVPTVFDYFEAQSLAELGFIVVTVDGRGTPHRSKAFFDHAYGHMGRASELEDHIAAIRQLARDRPFMDLQRVGVDGASGGGYAAARAILRYPDFYKVAVAAAGTHDLRGYHALYGETYNGPLGAVDYDAASNLPLAAHLAGKLLLAHGEMDDNVSPSLTLKLVDALIEANRDFDLLILPNRDHEAFASPYFIRRKWDYFVRHLMGAEPPAGYSITPSQ